MTAKDIILAIIGKIGTAGATGYVVEYTGAPIRHLSMEARMTICNMSIEAGARAGMIAPDDTTFAYLKDRKYAPKGERVGSRQCRFGANSEPTHGATYDTRIVITEDGTRADGFVGAPTPARPVRSILSCRRRPISATKPTPEPAKVR